MKKNRDFVNTITKLTKDFTIHKHHCFKYGSKQLKNKLLNQMKQIEEDIVRSIEVVNEEMTNGSSNYKDSFWKNQIELLLESEKWFSETDYYKFLRVNYQELEKLIREYARTKLSCSLSLDKIIGLMPEYADQSPEFPDHLACLGILKTDEEFFCKSSDIIPELIKYYKQKLVKLLDEKMLIDRVFKVKLEIFIKIQEHSLEEVQKNYKFLVENSIDEADTVKYFFKFSRRGYLDSLD